MPGKYFKEPVKPVQIDGKNFSSRYFCYVAAGREYFRSGDEIVGTGMKLLKSATNLPRKIFFKRWF